MNKVSIILALFVACMITGCSHNAVTYSKGLGFETTIRPDTGNFGLTLRYGDVLTAVMRENSELELQSPSEVDVGTSAAASTSTQLKFKVGKQITGYYVDAIEAGVSPEELDAYTDTDSK